MESLALIAKSNVFPNPDVTPLVRELFQTELESTVPSKKLAKTLRKSLENDKFKEAIGDSFQSLAFPKIVYEKKKKLMDYAEDTFQAYNNHEEILNRITEVEFNIMESQAVYLHREKTIKRSEFVRDFLKLKRHPLLIPPNSEYIREYRLLQGNAGLPLAHEIGLDFRLDHYNEWKEKLDCMSQDNLLTDYMKSMRCLPPIAAKAQKVCLESTKPKKAEPAEELPRPLFKVKPAAISFTDYTPGETYERLITIRNVCSVPKRFCLKPLSPDSPFRVLLCGKNTTRIFPGQEFNLSVTFNPKNRDDQFDSIVLLVEDGSPIRIPLSSYLEPPLLKTDEDIDELTKNTFERVQSSNIDCDPCFSGDSNVTKIRFYSCGGFGEFFLMSEDDWTVWHIRSLTEDNFTEIPPFRFYPTYFTLDKNQVIDLYVEFSPLTSGLHSDNVVIACSNGEVRNLDILGDGIAWNRRFILFEECLEKNFPADVVDDDKAVYWLNLEGSSSSGLLQNSFTVSNISCMPLEFRWEMRDIQISFYTRQQYSRLKHTQIKIVPPKGTFKPNSAQQFTVTIALNNNPIGEYRSVLSLYIIGLPRNSIEDPKTIIRPSLLQDHIPESFFGEEENLILSPEISDQGMYESIKTSETEYQQQFPTAICQKYHCSIPLRRSKTFSNISSTYLRGDSTELEMKHPEKDNSIQEALGSELLSDFVDVLVDEVELWAEVLPTSVLIEPPVIDLCEDLRIDGPPMRFAVYVVNCSNFHITCTWMNLGMQNHILEGAESNFCDGKDHATLSYLSQGYYVEGTPKKATVFIKTRPNAPFTVPPLSRYPCTISITAFRPGAINEVLRLSVDNIKARLFIVGFIPEEDFVVTPKELNFGAKRQGNRYLKHFKIRNCGKSPLEWTVDLFNYDFNMNKLTGPVEIGLQSNLKRLSGVLPSRDCCVDSYTLDARQPGLQCSLLRFQRNGQPSKRKYLVVMGDVQTPEMFIEDPRFKTAILAPCGSMYVGKPVRQRIVLQNVSNIVTPFVWGHPFGCHCRRLSITISPRLCSIKRKGRIAVHVTITPLSEGIVEHCYVPCFSSWKAAPIVLSVVGLIKNVELSFRIPSDEGSQPLHWPIKNFDPTLGLGYLHESDVLDFRCHCDEIEAMYLETSKGTIDNFPNEVTTLEEREQTEFVPESFMGEGEDMGPTQSIISEYPKSVKSSKVLQYAALELQFLNVFHKKESVKHFVIKNESPIRTRFSLQARYFGRVSQNEDKLRAVRERVEGRSKDDHIKGQPLVITISPSEGFLNGWESISIRVSVLGDTWGEYRDFIVCDVCGLPPFLLKVFVQLSGHPVFFPMFATFPRTTQNIPELRFGTIKYKTEAVIRRISIKNTSSIPITLTWMVFLTKPLSDDWDKPFNLCLDLYTDMNSDDLKTSKSSLDYLSKNASGSAPVFNTGTPSNESCDDLEKVNGSPQQHYNEDLTPLTPADTTKPEIQLLENFGKIDNTFQIHPRELNLEPYQNKTVSIMFDPKYRKQCGFLQDFEAVVTGCVRLRQEHAYSPDIYYRPNGKDYVSKLLLMSASVEKPVLRFDLSVNDLVYSLNANDVLKAGECRLTKKYTVRNKSQTAITTRVFVQPGEVFAVRRIKTPKKFDKIFDPKRHNPTLEPHNSMQVELEMAVDRNSVLEMYENMRRCIGYTLEAKSSKMVLEGTVVEYDDVESDSEQRNDIRALDIRLGSAMIQADSLLSAGPQEWGAYEQLPFEYGEYGEYAWKDHLPKAVETVYVCKEDLVFEQVGLLKQVLTLELRVFFPLLRIHPKEIDFGDVIIGETALRYVSIDNLTQNPAVYRVTPDTAEGITVTPEMGCVIKSTSFSVEFTPRRPGLCTATFTVFGNPEMVFQSESFLVSGCGTWDEKYKHTEIESANRISSLEINPCRKLAENSFVCLVPE